MTYGYEGVKFGTEFVRKNIPQDERIVELKEWCEKFHSCNLAPPYGGGPTET